MFKAMFTLAWFGLLRPGEFTTPSVDGFDVTVHPSLANVFFYDKDEQRIYPRSGGVPAYMVFVIKQSKTDQQRLTQNVVVGRTGEPALCAVAHMWDYMAQVDADPTGPLFSSHGVAVTYARMRTVLTECLTRVGEKAVHYGGHSFRIGGAQALACAGKSVLYIMSYGRWRCVDSVLRYVTTPEFIRTMDAADMAAAVTDGKYLDLQASLDSYYQRQSHRDRLFVASSMAGNPHAVGRRVGG